MFVVSCKILHLYTDACERIEIDMVEKEVLYILSVGWRNNEGNPEFRVSATGMGFYLVQFMNALHDAFEYAIASSQIVNSRGPSMEIHNRLICEWTNLLHILVQQRTISGGVQITVVTSD